MLSDKRNIAVIIPGGIGTGKNNIGVPVLERLIKLLAEDNFITVFSLFQVNQNYKAKNFELISISSKSFFIRSLLLFMEFRKLHKQRKFNAVHGYWALPSGLLSVILGKIFRIKSIVSVLGGDGASIPDINYGELRRWHTRQLILWSLRSASVVTVLTKYLHDNLERAGLSKDVQIIPWGIDTVLFSYVDKRLDEPIQFLHVANLSSVKDQITLLRAFKIICEKIGAHLIIIGEGACKSKLQQEKANLNLLSRVSFLDPVSYEELVQYYHNAVVLLHTSLSEGQSEVVTEAMSSGVLVCGTAVGLLYDLPHCCVSVEVKDYENLANQVLSLLKDQEKRDLIRKNARDWAVNHSIHWTAQEINKLYRS